LRLRWFEVRRSGFRVQGSLAVLRTLNQKPEAKDTTS
jgi:hypothetical protein